MEMDRLDNKKIAIIGMGHMGKALLEGLLSAGFEKENILVSDTKESNREVAAKADWILLAVKPLIVGDVLSQVGDLLRDKILISVAAGVNSKLLANFTNEINSKIVRIMPNLPIKYTNGILGFYANDFVTAEEKQTLIAVFSRLGTVIDCKQEEEIDAITLIAGCGPALVAYFIQLLSESGKQFGLEQKSAETLALQTVKGTLEYMQKSHQDAQTLQQSVATKGGVTEAIIHSLNEKEVPAQFITSLEEGYARIKKVEEMIQSTRKNI